MSQYFRFQLNPQCEKRRYIHEFRSLNTFYLLSILMKYFFFSYIPPPYPSLFCPVFILCLDIIYCGMCLVQIFSTIHLMSTQGWGSIYRGNNLSNNLLTYSSLKTSDRTSNVITREIIRLTCQGGCKEGWIISAT